jgi:hypothetical protein
VTRGRNQQSNDCCESRTKGGQDGEKTIRETNQSGLWGETAEEFRAQAQVVCPSSAANQEPRAQGHHGLRLDSDEWGAEKETQTLGRKDERGLQQGEA